MDGQVSSSSGDAPAPQSRSSSAENCEAAHNPMNIRHAELSDLEKIASGFTGEVYRGKCRGKTVAVKCIKIYPLLKSGKTLNEVIEDFKNEVQITQQVPHPNIVQFMGWCTEANQLLILSEFMEGGCVETPLFEKKFSVATRIRMAKDVASGMAWMSPRIIHRDLKLANLLLTSTNTLKICDFGFSQLTKGQPLRDSKTVRGSPPYIAPEVWKRNEFDFKTDVYSFGIVLYEFLVEKPAYHEHKFTSVQEIINLIVRDGGRPTVPPKIEEDYPEIVALMKQCWDVDPNVRPTFPEIVTRLEVALITVTIKDEQGRAFWRKNFSENQAPTWGVFWPKFSNFLSEAGWKKENDLSPDDPDLETLVQYATDYQLNQLQAVSIKSQPIVRKELQRRYMSEALPYYPDQIEVECLKAIFASPSSQEGVRDHIVSIDNFGKMLTFVGPIVEASGNVMIVDRIVRLVSHEWFHGLASPEQSETRLQEYFSKNGAFLVRLSTTNPGCYTISFTNINAEKFVHRRIEYVQSTHPAAKQLCPGSQVPNSVFKFGSRIYPSIEASVNHFNIQMMGNLPPCRGTPYSHIFSEVIRQYISQTDQNEDLPLIPVGTKRPLSSSSSSSFSGSRDSSDHDHDHDHNHNHNHNHNHSQDHDQDTDHAPPSKLHKV